MFKVQASRFKGQLKLLTFVVLTILISTVPILPVLAATAKKTVEASATLAYNLRGLNHNLAVQKAYIASTYLYVT